MLVTEGGRARAQERGNDRVSQAITVTMCYNTTVRDITIYMAGVYCFFDSQSTNTTFYRCGAVPPNARDALQASACASTLLCKRASVQVHMRERPLSCEASGGCLCMCSHASQCSAAQCPDPGVADTLRRVLSQQRGHAIPGQDRRRVGACAAELQCRRHPLGQQLHWAAGVLLHARRSQRHVMSMDLDVDDVDGLSTSANCICRGIAGCQVCYQWHAGIAAGCPAVCCRRLRTGMPWQQCQQCHCYVKLQGIRAQDSAIAR